MTSPRLTKSIGRALCALALLCTLPLACNKPTEQASTSPAPAAAVEGSSGAMTVAPAMTVADVNGTAITGQDLNRHLLAMQARFGAMGGQVPPEQLRGMRDLILDKLIEQELLWQTAAKVGIKPDAQKVQGQLEQMKAQFPSEGEYQTALARMELTAEALRTQMEHAMAIEQLIEQQVVAAIKVPDQELRDYYKQNPEQFKRPAQLQASHILVKVEDPSDAAQLAAGRTKILEAQKQLKAGKDFAALAREVSQCPSAAQGGDLGSFSTGQMVKEFEDAALKLKAGQVSEPVQTEFGFHLIKLAGRTDERVIPFEEAREQLGEHLRGQRVKQALESYIEGLKKDAAIKKLI